MVSTVIRRIGVVGAMTLAGAGVAAGSAFADPGDLQSLPTDQPLGGSTSSGSVLGGVPVVGPIVSPILGGVLGTGQHPQPPHQSQPSRNWHPRQNWQPPRHSEPSRHVDCGCHHAPPPPKHCAPVHHCPPAPHHCPPAHHHHHKHHHNHHHHNHHQQHHHR